MKKSLTLSLIIPVYNEENHLGDCLESIASQTVMPDEVIVVNNNSTDRTAEIAHTFSFVKIIHEEKQGLTPARNRGFEEAEGEILGRLDADSVLEPDWVETARGIFKDKDIDAITGPAKVLVDSHFPNWKTVFWSRLYFWFALAEFRFQVLWGPNMAVRRRAWNDVREELCGDDHLVHEDQDLSVILKAHGKNIKYIKNLLISTDGRRQAYLPKALEYNQRHRSTMKLHKKQSTLYTARQKGCISYLRAKSIFIGLLPAAFLFGIFSGVYSLERKLGLHE